MGIEYSKTKVHWNYFLMLEQDFQNISRYIEPCEKNNNTFSLELARIIMSSAQETDVIMKSLCKLIDSNYEGGGINQYYKSISEKIPEILSEKITIPRFSMSSSPWENWEDNKPPLWWTANNKIKHHRTNNFDRATLKNAFNSLAALLITTSYFYKKELEKEKEQEIEWYLITQELVSTTKLFRLNEDYYSGKVIFVESEW